MCGGFAPPRPAGYLDQNEGRVAFGSDEMADELLNCEPRRAARAGGREARRAARAAPLAENLRPVRAGMAGGQYKPLTEAGVEKIHQSALEALEVIGLSQAPKSGVEILTGAGAIQGDDGRIRFPRALVEDMLAVAARNITLHARDPKFDLHLSGTNVHYGTAGAAVHIVDPVTLDYRESTAQDLYDAARLVENLDNIHFYQRTMVCRDVVDNKEMDLNTLYGCLAGTRKHVGTSFSDPSHVADCFDMLYTVAGGEEKWLERPFVSNSNCFVVPPMKFAEESCITMEDCVRRGMPMLLLSAGQAGATAPAPIALAIVQAVAEMCYEAVGMHASLLGFCMESLVLGDDLLGQTMRLVRGIDVTEDSTSIDAMKQVCLGGVGHYLGSDQTLSLMQTEYVYPAVGNRMSPKEWNEAGKPLLLDAAIARKNEILAKAGSVIDPDIDRVIRARYNIFFR